LLCDLAGRIDRVLMRGGGCPRLKGSAVRGLRGLLDFKPNCKLMLLQAIETSFLDTVIDGRAG
jgi:hypothetical protein